MQAHPIRLPSAVGLTQQEITNPARGVKWRTTRLLHIHRSPWLICPRFPRRFADLQRSPAPLATVPLESSLA